MPMNNRRDFLKTAAVLGAAASLPTSIDRALALPARRITGTIKDVKHIVVLMQENRSFDHYFGTMRGVRGFGDRHTVPLPDGRTVWEQSNGTRILPPFWLDTAHTNGMKIPGTPHSFKDAQAAWNQGKFGFWPKFKTDYSMGYFKREDIPFQFALAEAFTLCDAYHCTVTSGTDPNRIAFWSGSQFDPALRAQGINCRDDRSEPNNLRCWVKGALPEPGYTYAGNALEWPTIPEVLEENGIDWRIYQDPNNNWTGAMHGGLAFKGFRDAQPGEPLYERGMRHWSLEQFARDVENGTLPAVSWVLPPREWSEHPSASSPIEGAEFTARVLEALTANPDVWGSTAFFQTFDENDGQFDHVPPPAPPSLEQDGRPAGKATFELAGHYFDDHKDEYTFPEDDATGTMRPWALGPRVPMYVVSPWSKGGWVNSEVFDHTSLGQFLEKRFDITIPAISPWHRAICGDLTSCFDFGLEADREFPALPDTAGSQVALAAHLERPKAMPPGAPEERFQEPGLRRSRALPYTLHVDAQGGAETIRLNFANEGAAGVNFHVYDRLHLDRLPRRYAVDSGLSLSDSWQLDEDGAFDLLVLGPNGFMRAFTGSDARALPAVKTRYTPRGKELLLSLTAPQAGPAEMTLKQDLYGSGEPQQLSAAAGATAQLRWPAEDSHGWYDFVLASGDSAIHFAGRVEDGSDSYSDPLLTL
ncbi:MAG: phospholipase C, phosphocholine-specific [Sphingomonadales bacterium 32-64-17]|nr:MAG: phospholipase C, phosphocholine-specific [Sphingomonadales bacterium 32-64-17]